VASRPAIYKIWKRLERFSVPAFVKGYTVNGLIAGEFQKMYGVSYEVIRNLPLLEEPDSQFQQNQEEDLPPGIARGKFILYQGAVNEGRCFETLIPAMEYVDTKLVICGNGNYMSKAMDLAKQFNLEEKVIFTGYLLPAQLKAITRSAIFGINFLERSSANNYFSLANRFFDYMHACIPQVTMNYPAYREINNLYPIAVLIDETGVQSITEALNGLLSNKDLYQELQENCKQAKLIYNWQMEENKLLRFYNQILN
jgi:glycosyltransferase involved in cell wall biosynthesis